MSCVTGNNIGIAWERERLRESQQGPHLEVKMAEDLLPTIGTRSSLWETLVAWDEKHVVYISMKICENVSFERFET